MTHTIRRTQGYPKSSTQCSGELKTIRSQWDGTGWDGTKLFLYSSPTLCKVGVYKWDGMADGQNITTKQQETFQVLIIMKKKKIKFSIPQYLYLLE